MINTEEPGSDVNPHLTYLGTSFFTDAVKQSSLLASAAAVRCALQRPFWPQITEFRC